MSRVGLFGQISEINDHLFLSGAGVLRPEKLKQKGITCVINATVEEPTAHLPGIDSLRIRIEDSPFARLDHYFEQTADKIKSVKERGGNTLVHCVAGVSRSASLCIAYLMKHERMSLRQAYHYVKSARPIIRPNLGFWQQLVDYERKLRGHNTVTMVPAEGSALPFPDIYSNDLRRHILSNPGPPQHDPHIVAMQKRQREREQQRETNTATARAATLIPVQLVGGGGCGGTNGGSRHLAQQEHSRNGTESSLRHRHSASALPSRPVFQPLSSHFQAHKTQPNGSAVSLPWRMSSLLLSPAPNRRSATSASGSAKLNGIGGGGTRADSAFGMFGVPPFRQSSLFPAF
uniref:Protein-tyrosine-phosphatase n=1 Tax=Globodera pallida TaxID=36090 RepID=A0A183C9B4_GLOPA